MDETVNDGDAPTRGERMGIYLMVAFLFLWLAVIIGVQAYLIHDRGFGLGTEGKRTIPPELIARVGSNDLQTIMAATNKNVANGDAHKKISIWRELYLFAETSVIMGALTAFWYYVVSRVTPFPGTRTGRRNVYVKAIRAKPSVEYYPVLRRFTLWTDIFLFIYIVVLGTVIIPFMLIKYGLHGSWLP